MLKWDDFWRRCFLLVSALLSVVSPSFAVSYLEIEQMVREGLPPALIKSRLESDPQRYTLDEIIYLQEKKLPKELVEFLLRFQLAGTPEINVPFLLQMKSLQWSDTIMEMMVNRYGFSGKLSTDDLIILKKAAISQRLIESLIRNH